VTTETSTDQSLYPWFTFEGPRPYLDGKPLYTGEPVEIRTDNGRWTLARYEPSLDEANLPVFRLNSGKSLPATTVLNVRRPQHTLTPKTVRLCDHPPQPELLAEHLPSLRRAPGGRPFDPWALAYWAAEHLSDADPRMAAVRLALGLYVDPMVPPEKRWETVPIAWPCGRYTHADDEKLSDEDNEAIRHWAGQVWDTKFGDGRA
jgi:hypothetical protein